MIILRFKTDEGRKSMLAKARKLREIAEDIEECVEEADAPETEFHRERGRYSYGRSERDL